MRVGIHCPYSTAHLDQAERLGVDHIQLRLGPGFPLDLDGKLAPFQEAANDLRRRGIEVGALGFYRNLLSPNTEEREADTHRLLRVLDLAAGFDTRIVGVFAGADPAAAPVDNQKRFVDLWTPLVARAEARGVVLAFENCPMWRGDPPGSINFGHTPEALDAMLAAFPPTAVGLELDPSHFWRQHLDPVALARRYASRVVHVHGKDHDHRSSPTCDRFPGLGEIDFAAFLGVLVNGGYRGAVTFEPEREPTATDPATRERAMATAIAHLRRACPAATAP